MNVGVYCVSVVGAEERQASIGRQLDTLGFQWFFVESPLGVEIEDPLRFGYARDPRLRHSRDLTLNEIACVVGHRRALVQFLLSFNDYAIILEDDAELDQDFKSVLSAALSVGHFDILKLEARERRYSGERLLPLVCGRSLAIPARPGLGATGICYSRVGALKAIRHLEGFQ